MYITVKNIYCKVTQNCDDFLGKTEMKKRAAGCNPFLKDVASQMNCLASPYLKHYNPVGQLA